MVIDFDKYPVVAKPNFKGGNKEYLVQTFEDGDNRIMHGRLEPGASIGLHLHEESSEIYYILKGQAELIYDDGRETVLPGQAHYCPVGHSHSLMNNGNEELEFIAIVSWHNK